MKSLYRGKIYTNETELYRDFEADHPNIHPDDLQDRIDFGGEVAEVCPVCGELNGKHKHGFGKGSWSNAYPD